MFVRLAKVKDCQEIYDLIKDGDSGMTTLPKSKDEVIERISWSKKSLNKKDLLIICDTVNGDSLQEIKLKLNKIDSDFWGGESKVKLKILKDSTEALISLNDNFMIDLNSENLDNLRSIFGDNKIKLS